MKIASIKIMLAQGKHDEAKILQTQLDELFKKLQP